MPPRSTTAKIKLPPIEPTKKHVYETEEDPITYAKFGAKGVVRVIETDTQGNPHYFHFDPDTFKKIQERDNRNPLTRNPITEYKLISPPTAKKREYSAAAKVI